MHFTVRDNNFVRLKLKINVIFLYNRCFVVNLIIRNSINDWNVGDLETEIQKVKMTTIETSEWLHTQHNID